MSNAKNRESWPLHCLACGYVWRFVTPPLPISLSAAVRLMRAQSKCVQCDKPGVVIDFSATDGSPAADKD